MLNVSASSLKKKVWHSLGRPVFAVIALCASALAASAGMAEERPVFVGSQACEACHTEQYTSFMANSGKSHSWKSVEKMLPKLTEKEKQECFSCHTTGYGQPGGFKSNEETPELANLSCETCHGPGSVHAESGDPADIKRVPDVENCKTCHNPERVRNFNFKPMLYHGGH